MKNEKQIKIDGYKCIKLDEYLKMVQSLSIGILEIFVKEK
jgi:hypothetical protein